MSRRKVPDDHVTVYQRADSPYWHINLYIDGKRQTRSGRKLNLLASVYSREKAIDIVKDYLGLTPSSAVCTPGMENLAWLKDEVLTRVKLDGRRAETVRQYSIYLTHLITILGPGYLIRDVNKADVYRIKRYMTDTAGNSPSSVNKMLRHVRHAFEILYDDEVIDRNPFKKFARMAEPDRDNNYLTMPELQKFLIHMDTLDNQPYARLTRLLVLTGRRLTEILYLHRSDIDLAGNRVLFVNNKDSLSRKSWILIPEPFVVHANGGDRVYSVRDDLQWFVDNQEGEFPLRICHKDSLSHWVKKALRGFGRGDLHLHNLRDTFITLAGKTTELWRLQRHVQHSSIQVTEGYFHLKPVDGPAISLNDDNLA